MMTIPGLRISLSLATIMLLSACVVDPATQTGSANAPAPAVVAEDPPPPPQLQFAANYLAKNDGEFTVPQIPVEKVPVNMLRQEVDFPNTEAPGTIIIHPGDKSLHFVLNNKRAIRYGIAVGKEGFGWAGEANITNRRHWPTWTPPKEMIERKPELEKWKDGQPGGPTNPLGARALYLTTNGRDYGYRIHGTPDWWSIGRSASSGCFRMINQDVMDLYERVPNGAKVIVLNSDGSRPNGLKLPPPQPVKAKAPAKPKAKPAATAAAATTTATPAPSATLPTAATGPMSTPAVTPAPGATGTATDTSVVTGTAAGALAVPPSVTPAPATVAPAAVAPVVVQPAPVTVAPAAPAPAPAAAPTPVVIQPAPAPLPATPTAPACGVPLVNGVCPQG